MNLAPRPGSGIQWNRVLAALRTAPARRGRCRTAERSRVSLRAETSMTQGLVAMAKTRAQISERTLRKDNWRRAPAVTAVLLTIWVAYATTHVFIGHWYWVPKYHYLTP